MSRNPYDYYPTPPWCYEKLPIDFSKYKTALEPCCGDYRIAEFLEFVGVEKVEALDIQYGEDFFAYEGHVDLILTNPPYSIAEEFVIKALHHADTVVMLLRLNFLGAQKRYKFWIENEPDALFVLSKRPSFTGKGTDSTEYAWFVWQNKEKHIPSGIQHIL